MLLTPRKMWIRPPPEHFAFHDQADSAVASDGGTLESIPLPGHEDH